jgi:sulfide dehydrogenase [flavocytochrome c] flavoprotein subunit
MGAAHSKGAKVVVIGGGSGGATAAKYLRQYDPALEVTLVEPNKTYATCYGSNWVLGGLKDMKYITQSYDALASRHGVKVVHDMAKSIDPKAKKVTLAGGGSLAYDKLVVSPGIDFRFDATPGYDASVADDIPHAWKAGPQTEILRKQLMAMPDGGVFVLVAPGNPFRCPPGPYERASMVAHYFKQQKPKSKIIILDNKERFSKQGLFQAGWEALYGDMIEWVPSSEGGQVERIDAKTRTAYSQGDLFTAEADVMNFIPRQKAGVIATATGLTDDNGWCPVDQATFESTIHPDIYVIGDSCIAGKMPKSGHSANNQGKVVAAAVVLKLNDQELVPPSTANTCYSLVAPDYGISVAAVYALQDGQLAGVKGAGGVSPSDAGADVRRLEAVYAEGWYKSITSDIWG